MSTSQETQNQVRQYVRFVNNPEHNPAGPLSGNIQLAAMALHGVMLEVEDAIDMLEKLEPEMTFVDCPPVDINGTDRLDPGLIIMTDEQGRTWRVVEYLPMPRP